MSVVFIIGFLLLWFAAICACVPLWHWLVCDEDDL